MHLRSWLLSYDIRDKKRLSRVYRIASNLGIQINYSVYYLELEPKRLAQMLAALTKVIDRRVDFVRLYPCSKLSEFHFLGATWSMNDIHCFSAGVREMGQNFADQAVIDLSKDADDLSAWYL
jgi:CRISPR-associated protein Cas2